MQNFENFIHTINYATYVQCKNCKDLSVSPCSVLNKALLESEKGCADFRIKDHSIGMLCVHVTWEGRVVVSYLEKEKRRTQAIPHVLGWYSSISNLKKHMTERYEAGELANYFK